MNPSLAPDPSVERAVADYARGARAAWRRDPLRHAWRCLRRRRRESGAGLAPVSDGTAAVPAFLRPPSYHYRDYDGPWLEEHFRAAWEGGEGGAAYLPVFFDSLFFHAQAHAFLPGEFGRRYRALWRLLDEIGASDRAYFAVLGMYDFPIWDWHRFPRNVVVFAAGGHGDVAIPILKGDRPFRDPPKDLLVSFMGSLEGFSDARGARTAMKEAFADVAKMGSGPDWEEVMGRSTFSLCPRGLGLTSFRLFEALSLGSIPVYLWRDRPWLPYADELDWSSFALVAEAEPGPLAAARRAVLETTPERAEGMRRRIAEVYPGHFTYDGACARIRRRAAAIGSRAQAETLTRGRVDESGRPLAG